MGPLRAWNQRKDCDGRNSCPCRNARQPRQPCVRKARDIRERIVCGAVHKDYDLPECLAADESAQNRSLADGPIRFVRHLRRRHDFFNERAGANSNFEHLLCKNIMGSRKLAKGNMLNRPMFAGFLAAVAGVLAFPGMMAAHAQNNQRLCAGKGSDDRARPLPAAIVPQARKLFGFSPNTPNALVRKTTSFRCMKGKAWLCNDGANLVCGKADTSRTSRGAEEFCRQNPGSAVVPMAATGHATVFAWTCAGNEARISRRIARADPRGFIAGNWKRLQ